MVSPKKVATSKPAKLPKSRKSNAEPSASREAARNPLLETPSAKQARDRIADYVKAVGTGRTFAITSRGKIVAILAPPSSLPEGERVQETITTTQIKNGKRLISMVPIHGPYSIQRSGSEVAVLYTPATDKIVIKLPPAIESLTERTDRLVSAVEQLLAELVQLDLLREAKEERVKLRIQVDGAIRERVALLRNAGDNYRADMVEEAHRKLGFIPPVTAATR